MQAQASQCRNKMNPLVLLMFLGTIFATMCPWGALRTPLLTLAWIGVAGVVILAIDDLNRPQGWQRGVWLEIIFGLYLATILVREILFK